MTEPVRELRIYHVLPGRLAALVARFRDATLPLFARHGIAVEGPWQGADGATVVYLLRFASDEDRDARLAAFRADPDWQRALAASEADGPLTDRIETLPLTPLSRR